MFDILFLPFITCIIFTIIHTYFGIYIIKRGIIFVDLALAQIAALGTLIGFIFGIELHTINSYIFSFCITVFAAIVLSFLRNFGDEKKQEAVIGILYVFAAAVSILILSKSPSEIEHIKYMLVGNLLFVKSEKVIFISILYFLIGIFHYFFRKNFFKLIENRGQPNNKIIYFWDFIFFVTFGAVVTSSVEIVGVLLVFSFLIIPVISSIIFFDTFKKILFSSWIIGICGSILGIMFSVLYDLPTGATIVSVFCCIFFLLVIIKVIKKKKV